MKASVATMLYQERQFETRRRDRRHSLEHAAFPMELPNGARVSAERRRRADRRCDRLPPLELFHGVAESMVEALLRNCPVREFAREQVILQPGQHNADIFILLSGRLRVFLDEVGSDHAIEVAAGGCIGELSMIDGKPATAFVVAYPGSRLLVLGENYFFERVLPQPGIARNLLRVLTERMRGYNDSLLHGLKQQLVLEHIQKELRVASEIQLSMLPAPAMPLGTIDSRYGIQVFATMEPAREVGGDLYDYFRTDDGKLCVLIGDVSDKGMAAALFMARTVDMVRVVSQLLRRPDGGVASPGRILEQVNRDLCRNNASFMFVTMFLGVLDTESGEFLYCNAGHNAPYLVLPKGEISGLDGSRGPPLGVKAEITYPTCRSVLGQDELLFLYTDGITEASAHDDELFGEQRLEQVLRNHARTSAEEIVRHALSAVRSFAGATAQSDDITVMAVRRISTGTD